MGKVKEARNNYQVETALQPIDPAIADFEVTEDIAENYSYFAKLTSLQRALIVELASNMTRENRLTDVETAEKLGIGVKTIYNCRQLPHFAQALAVIVRETVRGNEDNILAEIYRAIKKDWRAGIELLKYDGSYITRSQQAILHANVSDFTQLNSERATVDEILIRFGELGLSVERVAQRMQELRDEGAF